MPTDQIIALLVAERDKLNRAIEALQGPSKRGGRPPKNPSGQSVAAVAPSTAHAKKHHMRSPAARKAQAARMRAYWAAKRKKEGK